MTRGALHIPRRSSSCIFLPSEPWLLRGTLQQNILAERSLDVERYEEVLKAAPPARGFRIFMGFEWGKPWKNMGNMEKHGENHGKSIF